MAKVPYQSQLPEVVREFENNYISGTTTISKYVQFDMLETLNKIDAYLNSKHTTGEYDSLDREKPFFNIVVAASNIWYRATDIDRSKIKIKAVKSADVIDAFLASVHLQEWMRRENFGVFLNEWGRVLARYGSAVVKFVENDNGLSAMVVPWNRLIVDPVDFDNNIKIEVIELTEAQLKRRKGYNKEMVDKLCSAVRVRETVDKQKKDNKNDYIKLYEVHGELPLSYLTGKDEDADTYVQQMHVVSFLAKKDNPDEYDEYTLISGREKKDPYMITHLIKEDGRTLSIGAVEHLFESQWMVNHSVKSIKDQLDLASKLIFQTSDINFVGQNALDAIETGDILVHALNQPLTQVNNGSHDVTSQQNFLTIWKSLGNEIAGISESMLGMNPPSGTAWRQTEALLQENHSLFELMTENKALDLEEMLRRFIIPYLKTKMDTSDEVSATLEGYDLHNIDSKYIKNKSVRITNAIIAERVANGEEVSQEEQAALIQAHQNGLKEAMSQSGNVRYFKPEELSDKTWKEQFKDLEWEVEVDITQESTLTQEVLATLNTALKVVVDPNFANNKKAQFIVDKILTQTAVISPLELSAIPSPIQPQATPTNGGSSGASTEALPTA